WLRAENIERSACNAAFFKRVRQRRFVDRFPAAGIDEPRRWLHRGKYGRTDPVPVLRTARQHIDKIVGTGCPLDELLRRENLIEPFGLPGRPADPGNMHTECLQQLSDGCPADAGTNHDCGLAREQRPGVAAVPAMSQLIAMQP